MGRNRIHASKGSKDNAITKSLFPPHVQSLLGITAQNKVCDIVKPTSESALQIPENNLRLNCVVPSQSILRRSFALVYG